MKTGYSTVLDIEYFPYQSAAIPDQLAGRRYTVSLLYKLTQCGKNKHTNSLK